MADNISIRDNSSGYNADLAQSLKAFAANNGELRDILRELSNVVKKFPDSNGKSNSSSIQDKEIKLRIKGAESLEKFTNSYSEAEKLLNQVAKDLEKSSSKIRKSDIGSSLSSVKNRLDESISKYQEDTKKSLQKISEYQKDINSSQEEIVRVNAKLEHAIKTNNDKEFESLLKRQTELNSIIKARKDDLNSEKKSLEFAKSRRETLDKAYEREAKAIADSLQARTELGSEAAKYKPAAAQKWESFAGGIKDYFQPKKSQQYLESKEKFDNRIDYLKDRKSNIELAIKDYNKNNESLVEFIELAKQDIQQLTNSRDEENAEPIKKRQEALEQQLDANKQELENLLREAGLIDAEYDYLKDAKKSMESNASMGMNILNSSLRFIQNGITKTIDREITNLSSAASEVFNSFESLQESLGKQLKLSSGAYEDMKDRLIAAADEAGKSIDVTQLNAAAASIAEMGITNQDLITQMAVGTAKLSEAGVSAQLSEADVEQMNKIFQRLKEQGLSDEDAAKQATARFDSMIAIEEQVRQQYDSVTALKNGGWEDIKNWTDRLMSTGDIKTAEEETQFMASMANFLQAAEKSGIQNPDIIMSDIDSVIQGTMTELPAYLNAWLSENHLDTESLYQALGQGDVGDLMMSLASYQASFLTGDAKSDAYVRQSMGLQMTSEQARAFKTNIDQIQSDYASADFSQENLDSIGESVQKGLEEGSYLSATKKLEKTNISLMDKLAAEFQDMPDGAFWMGQGFDKVQSIIDGAMDNLFNFLTAMIAGQNLFAEGGLGDAVGKMVSKIDLTTVKDFAFGNTETTAGKIGSYGTMAVGGVMSVGSAISNFKDAEDFEEGLINTFRDPQFTAGLGTTIGGAIGGPVGGAIGGALGSFVPTVSEALEKWAVSTIDNSATREEERIAKEVAAIEAAADKLSNAAQSHINAAEAQESELEHQKQVFANYDENQMANFLKQQGMTEEEIANIRQQGTMNTEFQDAVAKWVEEQQRLIDSERALSEGADLIKESFGAAIGVDNAENWNAKDWSREELEAHARSRHIEGIEDMSDKELAAALTSHDESIANKQISRNEAGMELMENMETWVKTDPKGQKFLNKDGTINWEKASVAYAKEVGGWDLTDEQFDTFGKEVASTAEDKKAYDENNEEFHKRLQKIIDADPSIKDYTTLLKKYAETYDTFDKSAVQGLEVNGVGAYEIDGEESFGDSGKLPNLKYHAETQKAGVDYDYNPYYYKLRDGTPKYKTGLEYVPMDDYMALLHQGEMVLNKTQADEYRKSSSGLFNSLTNVDGTVQEAIHTIIQGSNGTTKASMFDTTPLINSVNTQTDRIEALLTKILQVLTSRSNSGSKLPRSIVQMNSDISLL